MHRYSSSKVETEACKVSAAIPYIENVLLAYCHFGVPEEVRSLL